ncbi:hypothetical protein ROZALSC1DRAFT_30029 [Rozella allomycis CSF55]|uniref:XPG N-terminal domain-containing protein n=1 Tax=Rozella allomycis (strain CSF55) TaxID=988480 RepID=A0A075AN22_ROZAC|nr:hypothetical protein O9G_001057 [Rozella allomycis CSF55]RKP18261.1 hypothetical protein ROZALSC1DRAFT_30029 [Rozella allomycis CSF55]|eukprot:EPZ31146.1 hypothetical protein O9G_001057 [Rozella allomycis CSF55]
MGVHDLWKLLEGCSKSINPEDLKDRKLAIDILFYMDAPVCQGCSVKAAEPGLLYPELCEKAV